MQKGVMPLPLKDNSGCRNGEALCVSAGCHHKTLGLVKKSRGQLAELESTGKMAIKMVFDHVCMCVCVCVCESTGKMAIKMVFDHVCVCVCVCVSSVVWFVGCDRMFPGS